MLFKQLLCMTVNRILLPVPDGVFNVMIADYSSKDASQKVEALEELSRQ